MHEHGMWRRNMWMKVIARNINPWQWRLKSFSPQLSNMCTMLNSALLRLFQKMLYLPALAQARSWLFSHLHFFWSHCNAAIALFETNKWGCDFATQQCQNISKHAKMLQIETFRDLILPNTAVSAEFGVGIPGNPTHSGCGWPRPRQGSGRRIIV